MIAAEGAARKRLTLLLVMIVLMLAAGAVYEVRNTPATYQESALVVFSLPKSQSAPYAYTMFATSLISSADAITQVMMSPLAQQQMREAGGTADVSMALVNLYSEQYPDFGEPLANLMSVAPSAAIAHRSFEIAVRTINHLLAARQAHANVRPRNRILAQIIGDSGPVIQVGSAKRVYAGLAVLTLVALSIVTGLSRSGSPSKSLPAVVYR